MSRGAGTGISGSRDARLAGFVSAGGRLARIMD